MRPIGFFTGGPRSPTVAPPAAARAACPEMGFTRPEIVSRVRTAVLAARAAGYEGRAVYAYLDLVNPLCPGSREMRIWSAERRKVLGRVRRHREPFRERQTYLALR